MTPNRSTAKARRRRDCVGVLTFPVSNTYDYYSPALIHVLQGLRREIFLVTGEVGDRFVKSGNSVHITKVIHTRSRTWWTRFANYALTQLRLSLAIIRLSRHVEAWFFHNGTDALILPMLASRFMGRMVALIMTGSPAEILGAMGDPFGPIIDVLRAINLSLASTVVVHSTNAPSKLGIQRWKNKIVVGHEHFVDLATFSSSTNVRDRPPIIGFVGRLSPEKGILNLVSAIEMVAKELQNVKFLLIGRGDLESEIRSRLKAGGVEDRVTLTGFVPHGDLPSYYNQMRLLLLPSSTEGLPTVIVEALACGTPVLCTAVGSVPDIIIDGRTGFLLADNSPEVISEAMTRIFIRNDLQDVAIRGRDLAEAQFSYHSAVASFGEVMKSLVMRPAGGNP